MYREISSSWFKHWDFILLDLIVLQVIYVVSIMCRNGFVNPYGQDIYRQEAIILCLADICTVFFTEEYSGIMRRGYFQEFKAALKHVVIVYLMMISYLFLMKRGEDFSRISLVIFVIFGFAGLYLERLLWKIYLLKHKKVFYAKRAILILTTRDRAERVVQTVLKNTYNELEVRGVILADDDSLVGANIAGVPVVCKVTEIPDYIQTRWVDSMLINVREGMVLPRNLELTCITMGLTVHRKLARVGENTRNQQLDSFGGYVCSAVYQYSYGNFQAVDSEEAYGYLRRGSRAYLHGDFGYLYCSRHLYCFSGTCAFLSGACGKKWKKVQDLQIPQYVYGRGEEKKRIDGKE